MVLVSTLFSFSRLQLAMAGDDADEDAASTLNAFP